MSQCDNRKNINRAGPGQNPNGQNRNICKNKEPVFIQIRLKRDRDTGLMHVTESAQENLDNFTENVELNIRRREVENELPSSKNYNR